MAGRHRPARFLYDEGMRIDPTGWAFVLPAAALALVGWLFIGAPWGAVLLALPAFLLFFFRDPHRSITEGRDVVLSPADGRVMVAGATTGERTPPGNWEQITIFLSPMDVHVNRVPVSGRVLKVEYHPGRFLPAYRHDAGDLNEYTEITLDHDGVPIVFRQVVGVLARRIVCRVREGQQVQTGDRFGVMKFGSRMDIFLPRGTRLLVNPGDRVVAGVTVLASLAQAARPTEPR